MADKEDAEAGGDGVGGVTAGGGTGTIVVGVGVAHDEAATSQPLAALASQFEKPAAHWVESQTPLVQAVVWIVLQSLPQVPQLEGVVKSTSQPFEETLSQFARPALQAPRTQVPAGQVKVAVPVGQAFVQVPHRVIRFVLASQPGVIAPSQSAKPVLQLEAEQTPLLQTYDRVFKRLQVETFDTVQQATELSQPFARLPSQLKRPARHCTI